MIGWKNVQALVEAELTKQISGGGGGVGGGQIVVKRTKMEPEIRFFYYFLKTVSLVFI